VCATKLTIIRINVAILALIAYALYALAIVVAVEITVVKCAIIYAPGDVDVVSHCDGYPAHARARMLKLNVFPVWNAAVVAERDPVIPAAGKAVPIVTCWNYRRPCC
jgi:hypothetical protein